MNRAPLLIAFSCLSMISLAQSGLTVDTLWIHRSAPDEEDIDTYFPIVKYESHPGVAKNINVALQMQSLGYILNDKNKANLIKTTDNPLERNNLIFTLKRLSAHVLSIDIGTFHLNNGMSLNGWYSTNRYLFDTDSGQPLTISDIFIQSAQGDQANRIGQGLRKGLIAVMQRFQEGFKDEDIAKLDEDCQCECAKYLQTAFCEGKVQIDFDPARQSFKFSTSDCDWMNPRPHDDYQVTIDKSISAPWLTPYGNYLFYGGEPVVNDGVYKLWKGLIDGKIPVTFLFKREGCHLASGIGTEIYDRIGVVIPLKWTNVGPNEVKLEEMGGDGKPVATITTQYKGGMLAGKWTKTDGTKTLAFEAWEASDKSR